MLIKDRLKNDNSFFQKGGRMNKRDREPCKCFNKGKCTYGLACAYDHRCTIPKCGKFGHGAHVCRLRNADRKEQGTANRSDDRRDDRR